MTAWTFGDIPDQTGRTAIVTGGNTGIGLETARMLALRGANVVLACRNREKGEAALTAIAADKPAGQVALAPLDLADLRSVETFAAEFASAYGRLDLLINNAGVMVPPLGRTAQGFELQFGTNHLGHFALAGRLFPLVQRTPGSRVVVVASTAEAFGTIEFHDLNWEHRPYRDFRAYGQSKLANLLFALELHRRLTAAGSRVRVTAAHPGWTATDLQRTARVTRMLTPLFAMKAPAGALPTLRAATDPNAQSGSYWGPSGYFELKGPPAPARIRPHARDESVAARLWHVSELLTGVTFPLAAAAMSRAA